MWGATGWSGEPSERTLSACGGSGLPKRGGTGRVRGFLPRGERFESSEEELVRGALLEPGVDWMPESPSPVSSSLARGGGVGDCCSSFSRSCMEATIWRDRLS